MMTTLFFTTDLFTSRLIAMRSVSVALLIALVSSQWSMAAENGLSVKSSDTITPLVELYTSEGCSSCPPADEFLARLGKFNGDIIHAVPLAFHVDYWNWLGWTDPYSKKQYTKRQKLIAEYNRQRSVYTPELVVGGKEARAGGEVFDWIREKNRQASRVHIMLDVAYNGSELLATLDFDNEIDQGKSQAYVAIFENAIMHKIEGGENSGRTLSHEFVVRHFSDALPVDMGKTQRMLSIKMAQDWNTENLGMAVVVVDVENGETLQALSTPLKSLYASTESKI